MIYVFDLHLMHYDGYKVRPIGYDFIESDTFPTDNEIYDAIMKRYECLSSEHNPKKTYLFNTEKICIGVNFTAPSINAINAGYRLIVNNVRSIGKHRNIEKYIPKIEL